MGAVDMIVDDDDDDDDDERSVVHHKAIFRAINSAVIHVNSASLYDSI